VATAVGIGAELRWRERAARASRVVLVAAVYALLPLVTFFNLDRAELDADVGVGVLLGYAALALATCAALISARVLRLGRPGTGALLNATFVANTGYLGYPLCAALLGFDSLSEAVVYDVLVSSPLLFLGAFGVGAAFGERAGESVGERLRAFLTRNPTLFAAAAALVAPDALAPDALVDASRVAVIALLPLGFFVVGSALTEEALDEGSARAVLRPGPEVGAAAVLRLVLAPGLLFLLALPVIDLPDSYLLLAAMPCGINTLVVAHVYGLDVRLTSRAVAWTTAIAVLAAAIAVAVT
jgi:malate permease and related proteins